MLYDVTIDLGTIRVVVDGEDEMDARKKVLEMYENGEINGYKPDLWNVRAEKY